MLRDHRIFQKRFKNRPRMLILGDASLHPLINIEKQLASVVDAEMLEAVRIRVNKYLLCAIKESLLVIIFSHQLRQSKPWVFALSGIKEDLSRKIFRTLNERIVELGSMRNQEAVLVIDSCFVHVSPLSELLLEVVNT